MDKVAESIKPYFKSPRVLVNQPESHRKLENMINIELNKSSYTLAFLSLIMTGLSTLILILSSLQQRKKDICLSLTIGANQNDIIQLFIIENISLSFIGGLSGIIMGVIGSYFLSTINHWQWVWNSQAITITILTVLPLHLL